MDPSAGFLGGVETSWHEAKKRYKKEFIQWTSSSNPRIKVDELVFVPNPASDCIVSKQDAKSGSWYPEFLTASDEFTDASCRLLAIKKSGVWIWMYKWTTSEHKAYDEKFVSPSMCQKFDQEVEVAVFEGQYCGHQISPTDNSKYSETRMELVKLFLWQCLASREKGQNISADIICLQEVPMSLFTYFKEHEDNMKLYCSEYRDGVITLVKKEIVHSWDEAIQTNHWYPRTSFVAFELSENYRDRLGTKWLTVINCHASGGDAAAPYFEGLLEQTQQYHSQYPTQLTIMTGDFNMNLDQDVKENGVFSSLLLGNKGIEASAVLQTNRANEWELTDVEGVLSPEKVENDQAKISKLQLVNFSSDLLHEGAMKNFSTRQQHDEYFLMDYDTNGDVFNFRSLSDHAPLLAEVRLKSRYRKDPPIKYASERSLIYKLFQTYRMDASSHLSEDETEMMDSSPSPKGSSSSGSPRSTSISRDKRGRYSSSRSRSP